MRQMLDSVGDRMLSMFLPKAKAGACACGIWDGTTYEYRCLGGQENQKRSCHLNCTCAKVCSSWVTIGDC